MFIRLDVLLLSTNMFLLYMFLFVCVLTALLVFISMGSGILGNMSPVLLSKNYEQRFQAYECGFDAFSDSRMRFDVLYYLIAILFLLFDVELVFLIPWSIFLPTLSVTGFWIAEFFMIIVTAGFVFEYKLKALDWQNV